MSSVCTLIILLVRFFRIVRFQAGKRTSWAGQEALIGTVSQYHTLFLEFGSKILTREFKQAEQDIQNRMKKKMKKMSCYGRPKNFAEV